MGSQVSKEHEIQIMEEYFANGMNATRAVLAVMPHLANKTARNIGSEVTKKYKKEIAEKKAQIDATLDPRLIMSVRDRKVLLSKIAQGIGEGDEKISAKDRITAIKVLNTMDGIGVSTGGVTNNYLSIGDTAKLVEKKLNDIIDAEYEVRDDKA